MIWCLTPNCYQPQNPDGAKFCRGCGAKLLLGDRYRPLKLLGRGGFGRTFLAVDQHIPSHPPCVVKQFFPQNQSSLHAEKAAELFHQEAMRLNELEHPQIPKLLAHFTQDLHQYLIQTFVDGQTLAQELAQNGAFDQIQIRLLLLDLLPVLQFLHDRQIIHRDIKPENIVRRRVNGQLVLVDFGASKFATATNLDQTGTMIGSAGYAAPEQMGGKATFASDLYSLGVTCVHLLTGTAPFDLYSFSEGKWIWRDYLQSSVGDDLGSVLDRLLEPAIARRFATARAVLIDLNYSEQFELNLPFQPKVAQLESPASDWACVHTLIGHRHSVSAIAICPSGRRIASSSFDKTVKLWHLGTGELISTLRGHSEPVSSIAFSPDGTKLISGSVDDTIRVWCLHTESLFYVLEDSADSVLALSVAVSPDGQLLVTSSEDRTVKVWHLGTGQLLRTLKEARTITSIAISPDGEMLAMGSSDDTIRLWNLGTGELLEPLVGHLRDVNSVAISADSQTIASGSSDSTIRLWNLVDRSVATLNGHSNAVQTVAFAPLDPDEPVLLIASGSDDTTVKIWDAARGSLLQTLDGHTKTVNSIAFSPDGRMLVSGSRDCTIKIWRRSG